MILRGGRADRLRPSDFDPKELRRGTKHELEHTNDPKIAREIAMDHLAEDEAYYEKLEAIERRPSMQANPHPQAGAGEWYPASGGKEEPFTTRTGRRLQYMWQPRTGAHAYYDLDRDIILSDDEAMRALGTFSANPMACNHYSATYRLDRRTTVSEPYIFARSQNAAIREILRRTPEATEIAVRLIKALPSDYCETKKDKKKKDAAARRIYAAQLKAGYRDPSFEENPIGGVGTALIVGAVALVGWLVFGRRSPIAPAAAATPATCPIDLQKLDRWGEARGFLINVLPNATPPTLEEYRQGAAPLAPGEQAVVVLTDGSFWYYITEPPSTGRADNLRADYCSFPNTEPPLEPPPPPPETTPSTTQGLGEAPWDNLPPQETWTHSARQFYHWNPYTQKWQLFNTLVKAGLIGTSTHPRYDLEEQIGNAAASSYDQYWIAEIFWVYAGRWYVLDDEIVMVGPGDGY
jgi:hypothetical protein